MITFVSGNIFDSPAQVITNTVNCVGVMGKGLALEFKNKFPKMFDDYQARCKNRMVKPGEPYLWEDDKVQILNFPTKRHWRENSLLEDIEEGLQYLANHYQEMGIYTLALPALGCANGGLKWEDVKALMIKYLSDIPDFEVFAYLPQVASQKSHTDYSEDAPQILNKPNVAAMPNKI